MLSRTSNALSHMNFKRELFKRQNEITNLQKEITSQSRLNSISNDPKATSHAIKIDSNIFQNIKFRENINQVEANLKYSEAYLSHSLSMLQRVKEIAIAGANGTIDSEERKILAKEVNLILEELLQVANTKGADAKSIFAGTKTESEAFIATKEKQNNEDFWIVNVKYNGNNEKREIEIAKNIYLSQNLVGSEIFWAENQRIEGNKDLSNFLVKEDSQFFIDNAKISITRGDSSLDIINKINESSAAITASLDKNSNAIVLESTKPHQISLSQDNGNNILNELGFTNEENRENISFNLGSEAEVIGKSIFDVLIYLRDNLNNNEFVSVGSRNIEEIDLSINNMIASIAEVGNSSLKLEREALLRDKTIEDFKDIYSSYVNVDITEAITQLNMASLAHQVALGVSAKIMQTSLLDFLR